MFPIVRERTMEIRWERKVDETEKKEKKKAGVDNHPLEKETKRRSAYRKPLNGCIRDVSSKGPSIRLGLIQWTGAKERKKRESVLSTEPHFREIFKLLSWS